MSEPTQYAAYPRSTVVIPDPNKLRALADGYFGLSWVFLVNLVLVVPLNIMVMGQPATEEAGGSQGTLVIAGLIVVFIVVSLLSYRCNRRIAEGMDWAPAAGIVASLLMGLNSALCCGVIGYAIMQSIASNKMRNVYGVRLGMFSGKKVVHARIAELLAQQAASGNPSRSFMN